MATLHPLVQPFDHVNMICPVGGELRYGFTLNKVNQGRQWAADMFADDPGQPDGILLYRTDDTPTCGTVKTWYKKGTNGGDGLPAVWRVDNEGVIVPTLGHRMIRRKLSDQTGIGSTPVNITGLEVAVVAGRQMHFRAWLPVRTSATSIAAYVACNGPAASLVLYETLEWTSASAFVINGGLAYNTFASHGTGNGATPKIYAVEGAVVFTADGTFAPRIRAESGGTCDVLTGAFMEFDLI